MNRFYRALSCLLWAGLFLMAGCRKSTNRFPGEAGKTVYVAGSNGTSPILWTNGSPRLLSASNGVASQVIASGSDIYVSGVEKETGLNYFAYPSGVYAYWKNGKEVTIGNESSFAEGLTSIAVVGSQVYFCGGSLWENGTPITLPDQGYYVWSVFSTGIDLYALGIDSAGKSVYWKNGQIHPIDTADPGTPIGNLNCIYVNGADVYVLGADSLGFACYWKNGVPNQLQSTHANAAVTSIRSIFVNGSDVYIAGCYLSGGLIMPAYWKNGVEQDLATGSQSTGEASGICVTGSDVFVTGSTPAGAVYWKNGVETVLAPVGYGISILVH